jgi:hypothetical protein
LLGGEVNKGKLSKSRMMGLPWIAGKPCLSRGTRRVGLCHRRRFPRLERQAPWSHLDWMNDESSFEDHSSHSGRDANDRKTSGITVSYDLVQASEAEQKQRIASAFNVLFEATFFEWLKSFPETDSTQCSESM